ncbi:glycoside hydrolase family 25 protein [Corynebacterium macclintockiae]|uniref:glycoside hydrolase family 25 protein n=1 Tax=Corynebacterium macclintockiae TaxID=2913501 RepID=UPI003EC03E1E
MISLPWRRTTRKSVPARLTATALAGTAFTVAALVATDIVPVPSWALEGVDVASHQHPGGAAIDWTAVKQSGQSFAFVKATEGNYYTNPNFSTDSIKAQQAGVVPGSYHYARPGNHDPRGEARLYATTLATGAQPSLPPTLDLEEDGGLNPTELQNWVREWVDEIKTLTGRDPIIYTYYYFWKNKMANTTEFSEYPLWLAYYRDTLPADIPGGWDHVTFWQYSDSGNVDGIKAKVDLNKYYGDDAALNALASGMSANTAAGQASQALDVLRPAANGEAAVANKIEHATGVNVPLATDFLMQVLGVIGGRVSPDVLLTQGKAQIQGMDPAQVAGSAGAAGNGGNVSGSMKTAQEVLTAYTALSGALKEFNAGGKKLPVEAILKLLQGVAPGAGAGAGAGAGKGGAVNIGQILTLLQQFGGISNWNAKLENGQVKPDANAFADLADAAKSATADSSAPAGQAPAPAGAPAPAPAPASAGQAPAPAPAPTPAPAGQAPAPAPAS